MSFQNNPFGDASLASPSRYDLFLDTYSPEIQSQYMYNLFVNRMVQSEAIETGTSKRFLITGRVGTYKHNFGDEFHGLDMEQMYRTIHLDDRPEATGVEEEDLVAMVEQIPARRGQVTVQIGDALSSWVEVETMKMVYAASQFVAGSNEDTNLFRSAPHYSSGAYTFDQTSSITNPTNVTEDGTGAQLLLGYIDDYVVALENEGIPTNDLHCVVTPKLWQEIFKLDTLLGTAGSGSTAGNVSMFADMNINSNQLSVSEYYDYNTPLRYNGVSIWKHSMFKQSARGGKGFAQDWSTVANPHAAVSAADNRNLDASNVTALLFKGDAIGFVSKLGPQVKVETPSRTDNELIRAKVWIGGGTLKPELATAFKSA